MSADPEMYRDEDHRCETHKRIAELEATLKRKDAEIAARGEYVERLKAKLAEYRGAPSVWLSPDANGFLHAYANGETRYLRDPHPPKEGE